MRGYLGRRRPEEGEGILLVPCNGVHTYGMSFPLDILFLDETGRVLRREPAVQPWARPVRVNTARYVLEVPVGTIEATDTIEGDELTWLPPRGARSDTGTWGDTGSHRARQGSTSGTRGGST
jgi:uncharacterized membrane protein (UPF0127 family)